jgi:hypothetical protein
MNSARSSTPLDLEASLRPRPEDVLTLRRARCGRPMALQEHLEFLRRFDDPPAGVLRARRGPRGDTPFDL